MFIVDCKKTWTDLISSFTVAVCNSERANEIGPRFPELTVTVNLLNKVTQQTCATKDKETGNYKLNIHQVLKLNYTTTVDPQLS